MADDLSPHDLLAIATAAADAAAAILLPRFGRERAIATKSSITDLVSEADLQAERAIRDVLAARVPDDAIMGEEGDDTPGTSGRRWIVDPLDGTVNYLYGIPAWCVSVACEGIAGVIVDPVRGERFAALAGAGATLDGVSLRPAPATELATALIATGFGYSAERRRLQAAVAARVLPEVRDVRRAGAAALDLAWCAAGRLDGYWERGVQPWDIAAGELICREAGLAVQRLEPTDDLPAGILACGPGLLPALRALVA